MQCGTTATRAAENQLELSALAWIVVLGPRLRR
jgi:hypothetical protein